MAHFLARGRGAAGNESGHGLVHGRGIFRRVFLHGAADLADHDDGVGLLERIQGFQRIAGGGADDRIAPNTDEGGNAEPCLHHVQAHQGAERA